MHIVCHLRALCPLDNATAVAKGSKSTHSSHASTSAVAWDEAWSWSSSLIQELQHDSTHTGVNTPFPWEVPGIYGSPEGFFAAAAMIQKLHAALSAVLDQQRHFMEHLCFSWRSLTSLYWPDLMLLIFSD